MALAPLSAMFARVRGAALDGIAAREVSIEVHARRGLPGLDLVGLPDKAVREARVRVRSFDYLLASTMWTRCFRVVSFGFFRE